MTLRFPARRIIIRLLPILAIAGILLLWLLGSLAREEQYLARRNQRWLGLMSDQISDTLEALSRIVQKSAAEKTKWKDIREGESPYPGAENLFHLEKTEPCQSLKMAVGVGYRQGNPVAFFGSPEKDPRECAYSRLDKVFEQSVRPGVFDTILWAERGKVRYQHAPGDTRVSDASFLFRDPAVTPAPGASGRLEREPTARLPQSTLHVKRQIGEERFHVFVQPLRLGASASTSGAQQGDWLLIGLTREESLWRRVSPRGSLLALVVVVALAALTWPMSKLWTMSRTAPLRPKGLVLIGAATVVFLMLVSVLGLYLHVEQSARLRTDQRLKELADSIGSSVRQELTAAVKQLDALDELAHGSKPAAAALGQTSLPFTTRILSHLPGKQFHLPFRFVDWIDENGEQKVRWHAGDKPLVPGNRKDRGYFRDIVSGNLLRLDASVPRFAVDRVISRSLGEYLTHVAIPSKVQSYRVASLGFTLNSLDQPVLPRDYGFAVIDRQGLVLYHSETSRILVENLYQECDSSPALRTAVRSQTEAFFEVNYSGDQHRLRVSPIPSLEMLPWSLIVFRDLSESREVGRQVVLGGLLLFAAYLLIIGLACAAACWVVRARGARAFLSRLAPWRMEPACLRYLVALAIFFFLVSYVLAGSLSGPLLFVAPLVCSAALLALSGLVAWASPASPAAQAGESGKPTLKDYAWIVWVALLITCLAATPTFSLGKLAYEYEMELSARSQQLHLWKEWEARDRRLGDQLKRWRGLDRSELRGELDRLLQISRGGPESRPVYSRAYFHGQPAFGSVLLPLRDPLYPATADRTDLSQGLLNLPLIALARVEWPSEARGLGVHSRIAKLEPVSRNWSWRVTRTGAGGALELCSQGKIQVRSALPEFLEPGGFGRLFKGHLTAVPWLDQLILAALLGLWVYLVRRRVLAGDIQPGPREPDQPADSEACRYLLLLSPPGACRFELPEELRSWRRLDPRNTSPLGLRALLSGLPESSGVVLERFEARFADTRARLEQLELLERLLDSRDRPVVIVSSLDPVHYLSTGGPGTPADAPTPDEVVRWRAALNYFDRRRLKGSPGSSRADHASAWDSCSKSEKLHLIHLATHGLMNPRAAGIAQALLSSGLLRRGSGGHLEFSNDRFRAFVLAAEPPGLVREWQTEEGARWRGLWGPLLLLAGLALVLMLQQELVGGLATAAGALETARRLVATIRPGAGGHTTNV